MDSVDELSMLPAASASPAPAGGTDAQTIEVATIPEFDEADLMYAFGGGPAAGPSAAAPTAGEAGYIPPGTACVFGARCAKRGGAGVRASPNCQHLLHEACLRTLLAEQQKTATCPHADCKEDYLGRLFPIYETVVSDRHQHEMQRRQQAFHHEYTQQQVQRSQSSALALTAVNVNHPPPGRAPPPSAPEPGAPVAERARSTRGLGFCKRHLRGD